MQLWAMWLVVVILLTIIEFATINLVSIWFIASALLAMITSFITDNIIIQLVVFFLFGIIFFILIKKFILKSSPIPKEKQLESTLGKEGIVTETIKPNRVGEVKVDGETFHATSEEEIKEESIIKVNNIEEEKLEVEEIKKYELDNKEDN